MEVSIKERKVKLFFKRLLNKEVDLMQWNQRHQLSSPLCKNLTVGSTLFRGVVQVRTEPLKAMNPLPCGRCLAEQLQQRHKHKHHKAGVFTEHCFNVLTLKL